LRVLGSLAIFGFLVGLMIGRLLQPDELYLKAVDADESRLLLWFNSEPQVRVTEVQGAFSLRFEGLGRERQGYLSIGGRDARWRIQRHGRELELRVLALQPLQAQWHAEAVGGRWRMTISLALR
jgi:hypothetical protein